MKPFALVLPLVAVLIAGSCGGGDGGGGGAAPVTTPIPSTGPIDGFVSSDGALVDTSGAVDVGDFDVILPVGVRGFWSFDLSSIPAGATIVSATFTVNQLSVTSDPYVNHGVVVLDHLDYGATLDAADYNAVAFVPSFATLSSDATIGPKGPIDVTALVTADRIALRTRTQFRARFSIFDSDGDPVQDHADFAAQESFTGNPVLTVTYTP